MEHWTKLCKVRMIRKYTLDSISPRNVRSHLDSIAIQEEEQIGIEIDRQQYNVLRSATSSKCNKYTTVDIVTEKRFVSHFLGWLVNE